MIRDADYKYLNVLRNRNDIVAFFLLDRKVEEVLILLIQFKSRDSQGLVC